MEPYSLRRPQCFNTFSMVLVSICSTDDSSGNIALISVFISSDRSIFLGYTKFPLSVANSIKSVASADRAPIHELSMMKSRSTQRVVLLNDKEGTSGVDRDFTDRLWRYRWLTCQYWRYVDLN